jgi:hypothetical protein
MDPGAEGRKKVCALVEDVLKDEAFVAAHLGDEVPERKVLYEDPELGFCILGHVNHGARESKPHDHGPSWAIYGQARGETVMSEWALVEPAAEDKPGKVRLVRKYSLAPGWPKSTTAITRQLKRSVVVHQAKTGKIRHQARGGLASEANNHTLSSDQKEVSERTRRCDGAG